MESWTAKVILGGLVLLLLVLIYAENQRKKQEAEVLSVQGLCSGSSHCLSQSSSVALSGLNLQSGGLGPGSQAPWFGHVNPEDHQVLISADGQSCSLSALSIANLQVDQQELAPYFLLHFGRCNQSRTARPAEMVMMAEITSGGPCGLRNWLCGIAPPFACHTTITTTSFTQTSTLHLEEESLKAAFQNPSLKCLGDREFIAWATSNQMCAQATLFRHTSDSQVCAYHFADSGCYVFNCREDYGEPFEDVTFCYELVSFDWKRRLQEAAVEVDKDNTKEAQQDAADPVPLDAFRIPPGISVSTFVKPETSEWVTEALPMVYRIGEGQEPAVLRTCQTDLDVIRRDVDAGSFYPYSLRKVSAKHSLKADIDTSCSPGYCGFNFQRADDLTDPLCWLKLAILAVLASYLATYLLESLQLQKAWNWLIISAESIIACCMCHVTGYDDLARIEQWGGAYAYTPLCAACSTRSVSTPTPEDHYTLEERACKSYSPAILDVLDTVLNGTPLKHNLDAFFKKLMSKRVFEEPGLVDCILTAETLQSRSCSSFADALEKLAWQLRLPNLLILLAVLCLTEVFNYEGLYLAEAIPALILAIGTINVIFLLRSLGPSYLWQGTGSTLARRGILLRLVMHDGERFESRKCGPLCRHVSWTQEKLETLTEITFEDLATDADVKKQGLSKVAGEALSQNGSLLDGLLHSEKLAELKGLMQQADADMSKVTRLAVQQNGLALTSILRNPAYCQMLSDCTVKALTGTPDQVAEALKRKSKELEILQLAVEQNGLALCIALDVVLHDAGGSVGDIAFSFFTKTELEKAVRAWRGQSFDKTMAYAEERRNELKKLKDTEDLNTLRECVDLQLMLILEEAIENHPEVLVKIQSISSNVEQNLEQKDGQYNHLVELAKALSYTAWLKYVVHRSGCCNSWAWAFLRPLLGCLVGCLVALAKLEGLGVAASFLKLPGMVVDTASGGCFLWAMLQPNSLFWAILLGFAAAILVILMLPEDPCLPSSKPHGGVWKEFTEVLEDLEHEVSPHILHAFVFTTLLNLCIVWLLCCICRWLHWCFAARACDHFVASGLAPAPFAWTDFLAQAYVVTAGRALAVAAASVLYQMFLPPNTSKVTPEEEEEEPPPPAPPPPQAPPEECYVQVAELRILKHRAGLAYHVFKMKRAFHLKITQKPLASAERPIVIRKTLMMHPSSMWSGGFHFNGSFWGHEKAVLGHDLHFQLTEPGTGKRWEGTTTMNQPIEEEKQVELTGPRRTGQTATLDLKLHSALPGHDPRPHWSQAPCCRCGDSSIP